MRKDLGDSHALSSLSCMFGVALVVFVTLVRNEYLVTVVPSWFSSVWATFAGVFYIPWAVLGHVAPQRVRLRWASGACAVLAVLGAVLWGRVLAELAGGAAFGDVLVLYCAAELCFNAARAWAAILATLRLARLGSNRRLVTHACAGVGGSYVLLLVLAPLVRVAPAWTVCASLLVIIGVCTRLDRPFFEGLRSQPSPQELSVTNPFSFIPLASNLYICIFLFEMTFGYVVRLSLGSIGGVQYLVVGCAVVLLGFAGSLSARALARANRHLGHAPVGLRNVDEDGVFTLCTLIVMLGFLLMPARELAGGVTPVVLTVGSQCFYALMFSVLAVTTGKNPVGALTVVATGFAVSAVGSGVGGALEYVAVRLGGGAHTETAMLITAAFAFVILVYTRVVMGEYSFARLFDTVVPAKQVAPAATLAAADGAGEGMFEARVDLIADERGLTAREREIAHLLARGRNGSFIQEKLVISRNTAKTHIRHIYAKLGVHSQQELIDLVSS